MSYLDLEREFDRALVFLVEANTEDRSLECLERRREVIDRCRRFGREALLVKAAVLEDNLAFYLPDANQEMLGWLVGLRDPFLRSSSSGIGAEPVWKRLSARREQILGTMEAR